ncbi:MAG: hypothetical protein H0V33_06720 [Acidimicrobiia bacterium]|jgi:hypothetical protein|nr:hypothetical protein [Acidimicrobiia bacterium]
MADDRTTVTELVTGLGTLGHDTAAEALAARPAAMVSVSPELWHRLGALHDGGAEAASFAAAFANGRAFLGAADALRGRVPLTVEWRGGSRPVDDDLVPADLRIDHVFLVSCKYLSQVVANAAPARLFDGLLRLRAPAERVGWFDVVAPTEYRELVAAVCAHAGVPVPDDGGTVAAGDRLALRDALRGTRWPDSCAEAWRAVVDTASEASAARWRAALIRPEDALRLLWRLLRIGPAPYFVLGVGPDAPLRRRVLTSWDWQQRYRLRSFTVAAQAGGQPRVGWEATVTDGLTARDQLVAGHVEIRWSHGRLNGAPEAKVYLDTPHAAVPGYLPLA